MKKYIWSIVILILAGGGWWAWKSTAAAQKGPGWRRVMVQRGDIVLGAQATGTVQPQNRVSILPPVPGRMEQILVREGDYVKRGQTLAWMSTSDRASLLDAARAKGPDVLAHWEDLYKATPLIAPITGTVILRNAETGQNVTSADAPLVLSDRLIVKAQVDETDIAQIKLNQKVLITLDAYPDQRIEATVNHIAYEARTVSNVTIYDVDVLPGKIPAFMRSGMTANAIFVTDARRNVLTVAAEAVQRGEDGGNFVYVPAKPKPGEAGKDAADADAKGPGKKHGAWDGQKHASGQGYGAQGSGGSGYAGGQGMGGGMGQGGPKQPRTDWPQPLTKAVEVGLSDGTSVEVLSGLDEGDRVLIKLVVLPKAAATSSPLGGNTGRPGGIPRGAR